MTQRQSDSFTQEPPATTRAEALKQATTVLHANIDHAITGARLFDNRERYSLMLKLQHEFQWLASDLYQDSALNEWLPGLGSRDRFPAIVQDCRDMGVEPPASQRQKLKVDVNDPASMARALGWLYTIEGSTLGAAFLFKWAQELGLSGEFGAHYLAPDAEGRGLHWRKFVQQINEAPVSAEHEADVIAGAQEAFRTAFSIAEGLLAAN